MNKLKFEIEIDYSNKFT